jgi:hypothetical protein
MEKSNKSIQKYDIGLPTRVAKKMRISLKKYDNIGKPRRYNTPSTPRPTTPRPTTPRPTTPRPTTPRPSTRLTPNVVNTPNTPRSRAWQAWKEKGEEGYISEHEEDDDDIGMKKYRKKHGIRSPTSYNTFEGIKTKYMTQSNKKMRLNDDIVEVDEEEWEQKEDDVPGKPGSPLIKDPHFWSEINAVKGSRRRSRNRSRSRSRSRRSRNRSRSRSRRSRSRRNR